MGNRFFLLNRMLRTARNKMRRRRSSYLNLVIPQVHDVTAQRKGGVVFEEGASRLIRVFSQLSTNVIALLNS